MRTAEALARIVAQIGNGQSVGAAIAAVAKAAALAERPAVAPTSAGPQGPPGFPGRG